MGTNLREPVPADPLKVPRFIPTDQATRAERAVESAALIKEAGMSARRLGVPLTMHDFPRDPDEDDNNVDTMHSSVPLFGLGAPRWRKMEGLPPHDIPGTASYDGVLARPRGNRGLQGWDGRARMLKKPLCKLIEQGVDPYGIGAAGTKLLDPLDVPTRHSSLGDPSTPLTTHSQRSEAAKPPSSAPARTGLSRTFSTTATIGSPPPPSDVSRTAVTAKVAKAKAKAKSAPKVKAKAKANGSAAKKHQRTTKRRSAIAAAAAATTTSTSDSAPLTSPSTLTPTSIPDSTSSVPELEQSKARPTKRGRRAAELDSTSSEDQQQQPGREQGHEETDGAEPPPKRLKRRAAAPTTSICHGVEVEEAGGHGDDHPTSSEGRIGILPVRRSTRVTRASAAVAIATQRVPVPAPAQRGQATKGKKAKKAKA